MDGILSKVARDRRPEFLRGQTRRGERVARLRIMLRESHLHTVCEQARCPNLGLCFGKKTAAFMILGRLCTRSCRFCAVSKGIPLAPDPNEPERVAAAALELGLKHIVITSVTRDDLEDRGANQFLEAVLAVKKVLPDSTVEVLTPDFSGRMESAARVLDPGPDVFNHNLETVPRLYPWVRPQADYKRSLALLEFAGKNAARPITKSGIMAGMGETRKEIISVMRDLAAAGCRALTIGQYLAPSRKHWPVARYLEPEEYAELRELGLELGFALVFAGPLVRSSFNAGEILESVRGRGSMPLRHSREAVR